MYKEERSELFSDCNKNVISMLLTRRSVFLKIRVIGDSNGKNSLESVVEFLQNLVFLL